MYLPLLAALAVVVVAGCVPGPPAGDGEGEGEEGEGEGEEGEGEGEEGEGEGEGEEGEGEEGEGEGQEGEGESLPTALVGDDDDNAHGAIPPLVYVPQRAAFVEWPSSPGLPMSVDTVAVLLRADATVGAVNALLADVGARIAGCIVPPAPGQTGVLVLRLPTTDHASRDAVVDVISSDPVVDVVAPDVAMAYRSVPALARLPGSPSIDHVPDSWSWDVAGAGSNWGLEQLRLPAAWNLNADVDARTGSAAVARSLAQQVGILDDGVCGVHEDLRVTSTENSHRDHNCIVAGVIGAIHGNGLGVEGVSPWAVLTMRETTFTDNDTWITTDLVDLADLTDDGARVVTYSLGYDFPGYNRHQDPRSTAFVATPEYELMREVHTDFLEDRIRGLRAAGFDAAYTFAAGNEGGGIDGRNTSPGCNLATRGTLPAVYSVESIAPADGGAIPAHATYSNFGGTIAAPGDDIGSTLGEVNGYIGLIGGTSFATPFVAGLISFLRTVDPSLTSSDVSFILNHVDVRRQTGGDARSSSYPDGYAALLTIDTLHGDDAILRTLVDIDDGTVDGNTRVDDTGAEVTAGQATVGDGVVDMSDFRRFRDWSLQTAAIGILDGRADHPKKDVNGDAVVLSAAEENVFPRGDFNGNGLINDDTTFVAGSVQDVVSDLGVLQTLFSDPDVDADELPSLLFSADVHVHAAGCFAQPGVTQVTSTLAIDGTPIGAARVLSADTEEIHTVDASFTAPTGLSVQTTALDANGDVVVSSEEELGLQPGEDVHVRPCLAFGAYAAVDDDDGGIDDDPRGITGITRASAESTTSRGTRRAQVLASPDGLCLRAFAHGQGSTIQKFRSVYAVAQVAMTSTSFVTPPTEMRVHVQSALSGGAAEDACAQAYVELQLDQERQWSVSHLHCLQSDPSWRNCSLTDVCTTTGPTADAVLFFDVAAEGVTGINVFADGNHGYFEDNFGEVDVVLETGAGCAAFAP